VNKAEVPKSRSIMVIQITFHCNVNVDTYVTVLVKCSSLPYLPSTPSCLSLFELRCHMTGLGFWDDTRQAMAAPWSSRNSTTCHMGSFACSVTRQVRIWQTHACLKIDTRTTREVHFKIHRPAFKWVPFTHFYSHCHTFLKPTSMSA